MRYIVVYEPGDENWSAYVPDLPGCVSTGNTYDDVRLNIRRAIASHVAAYQRDGEPLPQPLPGPHAESIEIDPAEIQRAAVSYTPEAVERV